MLESISLIGGIICAVIGVGAVAVRRHVDRKAVASARDSLVGDVGSATPPQSLSPGWARALLDGEASNDAIRISVIDIARRGHLRIRRGPKQLSNPHSWIVTKTSNAELSEDEQACVTVATATPTRRAAQHARKLMNAQLRDAGYFIDGRPTHSLWGMFGSLILLVGLFVTAAMLIDWLAVRDFRGVLGGLLLIAAGLLFASLGKGRALLTEEGRRMADTIAAYADSLRTVTPDALQAPDEVLVWAVAVGRRHHVAELLDEGGAVPSPSWFVEPGDDYRTFGHRLAEFAYGGLLVRKTRKAREALR